MTDKLIHQLTEDYAEYLKDESRSVGEAESISFPVSEEEVRAILKEEYAAGHRITVQGARTGLAAAAVPHGGHVLNLMKMNRVTALRKGEDGLFYITVEPGAILSQVKKAIESRKFNQTGWSEESKKAFIGFSAAPEQLLTPDPTESSATIGGMVSCNASGARSYLYGPTRGRVNALRVVLCDGDVLALKRGEVFARGRDLTLTTEGGKAIHVKLPTYQLPKTKNASGYYIADDMDAVDLFIGSDGTLGVITSIELTLLPMPATIWGVTCFFAEESQAIRFVQKVREEIKTLSSLEYFDGRALNLLRKQKAESTAFAQLPFIDPAYGCAVYTEVHCDNEEQATAGLFAIGDAMKACGGSEDNTWVARNASERDILYFFRHATPESVNMTIDKRKKIDPVITKLGSDMSVPDKYLADVVAMYEKDLAAGGFDYVKFGHIGNNHLHVNILPRNGEEYKNGKELFRKWAAEVTKMGGAVSAEHGVGKLKADFLMVMYGPEHIKEMAELKAAFDPKGLFGTGNLFTPITK